MSAAPTFLDLFCGCGGFTLGMVRAGFHCLAAIDFNHEAVKTLRANLCAKQNGASALAIDHALERDLTKFTPDELAKLLGVSSVDVIVGGPPCQGFSTARQVDGANHGKRLKEDPRRQLYREFLRYVEHFQPRVFVMENVLGIRSAAGGAYFTAVQKEAREVGHHRGLPGYRVHAQVEDAWELGVPQKRRRQLIIGVRNDLPGYFIPELTPAPRAEARIPLGIAIADLPTLSAGAGEDERDYDLVRREKYLTRNDHPARKYLYEVLEIDRAPKLTGHVARPHNDRDLGDFKLLNEGENSATAMKHRGVVFAFPYDKTTFKDRYTRQSRHKACSTIVAHLSKDGLMFIHPTQNRSLTPREAARIQSFPDWMRFPKARTISFRLIGNAVPPLVAEAVGISIKNFFNAESQTHVSFSRTSAAKHLNAIAMLDRRALQNLPTEEFLRGWHALLSLFPQLHPDNALDHGTETHHVRSPFGEPQPVTSYARSGWPVALELIGHEAWRRYRRAEITQEQLYCVNLECSTKERR
jgi:DNA (cytosine-5)-methyltransferase 1